MLAPQLRAEMHQERWRKSVADPSLRDLFHKAAPNRRGRALSLPKTVTPDSRHSRPEASPPSNPDAPNPEPPFQRGHFL